MNSAFKWSLRGLGALLGLFALLWTSAQWITSSRLDNALAAIPPGSQTSLSILTNWNSLNADENGASLFAAAFPLHGALDREHGGYIHTVLKDGWRALPENYKPSLRAWLGSRTAAFDLAAQGAGRPSCRYPRSWNVDPWNVPAPETSGAAFLGGSLIARAAMQAADGDFAGARRSIRLAFSVADSFKDEPPRETLSARLGLHLQILRGLLHVIPRELTAAECDEWIRVLPRPETYDGSLERAYQWDLHVTADLLSGPMSRFWRAWSELNPSRSRRRVVPTWLSDPVAMRDGVRAIADLRHELETIGRPYFEARTELNRMWEEYHELSRGMNPVRRTFVVPSPHYLDHIQMNRSVAALIKTGLEWEKTRIETGSYPIRCDSIDPCTGAPFVVDREPLRLTSLSPRGPRYTETHTWRLRGK
ncbi:MAG TPA: hypothetical protein VFS19_07035 [Planctomycetota bacterium]|nr:hypothetical protein [Planctomycetota bacterium]